jgi:hypothetical protein
MKRDLNLLFSSPVGFLGFALSTAGILLAFIQIGLLKGVSAVVFGLLSTVIVGALTVGFISLTTQRDRERERLHLRLVQLGRNLERAVDDLRGSGHVRDEELDQLMRTIDELDTEELALDNQLTSSLNRRLELLRTTLELLRNRTSEKLDQDVADLAVNNLEVAADTVSSVARRVGSGASSPEAIA